MLKESGINRHTCDLLQEQSVRKLIQTVRPSHLLHLAWFTEPGAFWSSPANFDWLTASTHLFAAFKEAGGRRIVGAGSCAEYDWTSEPCIEGCRERPATPYGRNKLAAFRYLKEMSRTANTSTAWARLFFLYGPFGHADRMPAAIITALLNGQPALCTHGQQLRDFLFIEDAADAIVSLLDSPVEGAVNIASGKPTRIVDLVQRIGHQLGSSDRLKIGALTASLDEPLLITADTTRLRRELLWQPKVSLEDGLQKTICWWKDKDLADSA